MTPDSRRFAVRNIALLTLVLAAACSSTGRTDADTDASLPDAGNDSGTDSGQRPLGSPCDPSVIGQCASGKDSCRTYYCDPGAGVCSVCPNCSAACHFSCVPDAAVYGD